MPDAARCPQCDAVLPADSVEGLCPQCLLRLAMVTEPKVADTPCPSAAVRKHHWSTSSAPTGS